MTQTLMWIKPQNFESPSKRGTTVCENILTSIISISYITIILCTVNHEPEPNVKIKQTYIHRFLNVKHCIPDKYKYRNHKQT